jgi:predicted phage terminase large subunit-like protein
MHELQPSSAQRTTASNRQARAELLAMLEERERRAERRRIRDDTHAIRARCQKLSGFVREAWRVLEPNQPYVHNWHIDAVCDHLEAITFGRINRLLINVPPGTMKSLLVSVLWPAWEWGPMGLRSMRFLTTSFAEGNVKRDTRKHRDLTISDWYQALWPEVRLTRTGEMSFANADTGTREGVAFASLTSRRGDRLIIDDPHSTETAESETERANTTRLFREGATNRLNDQEKSAIVVVMQRLHEQDVSGTIKRYGMEYVHLMLPMEFEVDRACQTTIGFCDPRTDEGELLDPVRFGRKVVDDLKRDMGAYAYAGQYQQRPVPRDGGLFKRSWFTEDKYVNAAPADAKRCRAWDLAATAKKANNRPDWTAGVRVSRGSDGAFYVEHVVRFQDTPGAVEKTMRAVAETDTTATAIQLPQDPGQAGKAQAETLIKMLAGYDVHAKPVTGDKETRARPAAAQAEAGNVFIVRGEWNEAFMDELCSFPSGANDDQVDAFADALNAIALTPVAPTAQSVSFAWG